MLEICDLHVSVKNKELLHGVDLKVPDDEVHALFGPNGSGKSVLIMTIMGYPEYEITRGQILLDKRDITDLMIDERVKLGLGISEQRPPTIKGLKLRHLVDQIISNNQDNQADIERLMKRFNIERFLDRDVNDGFSGGEIRQAELILVLITNPKFLLLDEPDSGVDPEHLIKIGRLINESIKNRLYKREPSECYRVRKSGLIVTHSAMVLDFLDTDKAHVMVDGKIRCSGNPGAINEQIRDRGYDYCIECQQPMFS